MNNSTNQKVNVLSKNLKKLREEKDYQAIIEAIENAQVDNEIELDKWAIWQYADALKRVGRAIEAEKVCKELNTKEPEFSYNNNLYAWCIFANHFKNIGNTINDNSIDILFQYSEIVTKITTQDEKTPYEIVVIKIIKVLKDKPSYPAKQIIYWLTKLNPDKLSTAEFCTTVKGKSVVLQSNAELYYSSMTKALLNLQQYQDTIEYCDKAFDVIQAFHHNNDVWIKLRKVIALSESNMNDKALKLAKEVLLYNQHWTIYHTIGQIYIKMNKAKEGLIYYIKAALSKEPVEMKIRLYEEIAEELEKLGYADEMELLYQYIILIRYNHNWNITKQLLTIAYKDIKRDTITTAQMAKINFNEISKKVKNIFINYLKENASISHGNIQNLLPNGKAGFITFKNKQIFFKQLSIINAKSVAVGQNVSFVIEDSFDIKKNKPSREARFIVVE